MTNHRTLQEIPVIHIDTCGPVRVRTTTVRFRHGDPQDGSSAFFSVRLEGWQDEHTALEALLERAKEIHDQIETEIDRRFPCPEVA